MKIIMKGTIVVIWSTEGNSPILGYTSNEDNFIETSYFPIGIPVDVCM